MLGIGPFPIEKQIDAHIITDLAVIDVTRGGWVLAETAEGVSRSDVQDKRGSVAALSCGLQHAATAA